MSINKTTTTASNGASMIVADIQQGTDEWHLWRSEGLTATDIPVILGLCPYKTPWMLWAEKVGRINRVDISRNPNVIRGNELEDTARLRAEEKYGEILLPICGEYIDWNVLRASFDGLNSLNMPHEIKAPHANTWIDVRENTVESEAYKMYECQTQTQCLVSGATEGRLFFYLEHESGKRYDMEFTVTLTDEKKSEILGAARSFWQMVKTKTPPPIDPVKDFYIPDGHEEKYRWSSTADLLVQYKQQITALQDQVKPLNEEMTKIQGYLIEQMGQYMQADVDGIKVTRFTKQGSIDYKAFLRDKFPGQDFSDELENYRKPSRSEARFTLSDDELVNPTEDEMILTTPASYF